MHPLSYFEYHLARVAQIDFLSFADVDRLCKKLSAEVRTAYNPDVVVGILRAGWYPALKTSEFLGTPIEFISIKKQYLRIGPFDLNDVLVINKLVTVLHHPQPQLYRPFDGDVRGKRVLLVDEDGTGPTMRLAERVMHEQGAAEVRQATLFSHENATQPHFFAEQPRLHSWPCRTRTRFPWCHYSPHFDAYAQMTKSEMPKVQAQPAFAE